MFYRNQVYNYHVFSSDSVVTIVQNVIACFATFDHLKPSETAPIFSPILQIKTLFQGHRIYECQNQCVDSHLSGLKNLYSRPRWCMPVILPSSMLRQEDYELQINRGYFVWSCQKQKIPRLLIWVDLPIGSENIVYEPGSGHCSSNGCH